ncbi:hypothetical protein I79_002377 [Cricetulus griseus]|uniref:Uncharacterized protein n=1 Tax=Cricetulus griseus TaxID=10029 RepID=G3GX63_CRIGR|nr:hypothetical protein I79_002377 [Cricetulus griseus]
MAMTRGGLSEANGLLSKLCPCLTEGAQVKHLEPARPQPEACGTVPEGQTSPPFSGHRGRIGSSPFPHTP